MGRKRLLPLGKSLNLRGGEAVDYLDGSEVSTSLGELTHLKYMDLSRNFFEGKTLEFVGSLKQLTYLNLSHAQFKGIISHHIGNLSNLKNLDLSSSPYQELVTHDLAWISGLSSLERLDLSSVLLTEAKNLDMVLYMIPSLRELHLSACGLSDYDLGTLRNSNITRSNIQHLDLSQNSFYSGKYPLILANMSSLRVLDLSFTILNSFVPVMPNLLALDLSGNNFERRKDVGIWRQCHLKQLSVSSNDCLMEFSGLPPNIKECSQYALERLDLVKSLNGTISESLGRMANLRSLNLSGNELTCPIPKSLGSLRLLQGLDLSHNKLTCSIPESLGRLGSLQALHLSYKKLNCSIPEFLGRLRSLQVLDLSHNKLAGSIPTLHGELAKLDLSHNHLNGSIPVTFGRLATLTYLLLKGNQLTGPIPTSLGRLVSLQTFAISSSFLNGTIPIQLGNSLISVILMSPTTLWKE